MKYFYNLCLLNIEVHFLFGFHAIYPCKICFDNNDVFFIVSNLIGNYTILQSEPQNSIVSPDPCSGSGYNTKLGHTGKVKLQFIISAFFKRHVGGMSLFIISFDTVQLLQQ